MSAGFGLSLRQFALQTGIKMDKVVRKVSLDLMSDLVKMTPVDTGAARSNWFTGYSRDTSVDLSAISKDGRPSLDRAAQFAATLHAGSTFYITNNLPYILKLEYGRYKGPTEKVTGAGFSTQAAAGMARVTVARWQQIVDGAVRGTQAGRLSEMRGEA